MDVAARFKAGQIETSPVGPVDDEHVLDGLAVATSRSCKVQQVPGYMGEESRVPPPDR